MTRWDESAFIAGDRALDFVNTAGGRTRDRTGAERLGCFQDAAEWAYAAGVVDDAERRDLLTRAGSAPTTAQDAVLELRTQREALHTFLLAGIEDSACALEARDRVKSDIVDAHRDAELSQHFHTDLPWRINLDAVGLKLLARRLGVASAALLSGQHRSQVSICGRCSWMFLDTSPTKRRRWCSMTTCGNRAKVQRHQRK